ncbi:hypothetical protein [Pseudoalteromonas xiamenensis]|uniref:Uncharacterized protein n=1 Tax=Pseudoalteromonas xiamenensis TaxID=882626 RepID=A0A975HLA4_9GAMM|nr:hypothetical protein [Pseudoalteromonas xiamenensis]QTH71742.1 hypothetical protein J5O05_01925 [Pseudoalteromonas xiamenensis]
MNDVEINFETTATLKRDELILYEFIRQVLRECSGRLGQYRIKRDQVLSQYSASLMDTILHSSPQKAANLVRLTNADLNGLLREVMTINQAFYLMPEQVLINLTEQRQLERRNKIWFLRMFSSSLGWLSRAHMRHTKLIYPTFFDCLSKVKKQTYQESERNLR